MTDDVNADLPLYTVSVVAERVGVPTATLRSWNQRYGVGPSDHSPGRRRLYSENDIATVKRMRELIVGGASPRSAAQTAIAHSRPERVDAAGLLAAVFDFDVSTAGRILDNHLRHFGVLDTWNQLVQPAFAGIDTEQAAGVECVDVEHLLSWTVSRSLQRLPIVTPDPSDLIILACTAGEHHNLALESLRAALGERGRGTLMLGPDVPLSALIEAVERGGAPTTVVLWSQSASTADTDTVEVITPMASVLVAGRGWDAVADTLEVPRLDSLGEAADYLGQQRSVRTQSAKAKRSATS